jgi:hypothetical protein
LATSKARLNGFSKSHQQSHYRRMCTENKSNHTYEQVVEDNRESTNSCISSISTLFHFLAVTCEYHILSSLRGTTDYFRDSINILSNNISPSNEYGDRQISGTTEHMQNKNEGPVILSYCNGTDSDNSPTEINELKSQSQLKTTTTYNIDKHHRTGPRVDEILVQSTDNAISVLSAGFNKYSETIVYQPIHKTKYQSITTNQHKRSNQNTTNRYKESSFNYYWPLDPNHNLDRAGFIKQVNQLKKINYSF